MVFPGLAAPERSCAWDTQLGSLCSRLEAATAGLRGVLASPAAGRAVLDCSAHASALRQSSQQFQAQLRRWGVQLEPATSVLLAGLVAFLENHVVGTTADQFARRLPLARGELATLATQSLSLRSAYESFCWDVERLSLAAADALAAGGWDLPAELAATAAELGLEGHADEVDKACCIALACKLMGPAGTLFAPALAREAAAAQRKGQGRHNSRVAFARTLSAPLGSVAFSMGMQAVSCTLAELFGALRERLGRLEWVGPACLELQAAAVADLHASLRRQAAGIKAACGSYRAAAGALRAALVCDEEHAVPSSAEKAAGGGPVSIVAPTARTA